MAERPILDACCGGRMMWFDKRNPAVVYLDTREESYIQCDGRTFTVAPDVVGDFTALPYDDGAFRLVVFDPPHLKRAGINSYMREHYGRLPEDWKPFVAAGFAECLRVLAHHGVLVFKWSEAQVPLREVLDAIGYEPLFGNRGSRDKTHWLCFMKGASLPLRRKA